MPYEWCNFPWTEDGVDYVCCLLKGHGQKPGDEPTAKHHVSGDGSVYGHV